MLLSQQTLGSLALRELDEGKLSEGRGDVDVCHLTERLEMVPQVLLGEVLRDAPHEDL